MIKKLSHATIYVTNQEEAKKFYTEKLGFEVRTDVTMEGFRWLTVGPKTQPELEIVLMEPKAGFMFDEATVKNIRELIQKGAMGAGVFDTADCKATYEELKGRGVEFLSPPQERPYGIEAIFKDNSGNWFSLTQH
ncbi:VOC family protein [candidate division KSB1 bacterium]|nr:VOC family protein [candidate division KSB1 bacterium]